MPWLVLRSDFAAAMKRAQVEDLHWFQLQRGLSPAGAAQRSAEEAEQANAALTTKPVRAASHAQPRPQLTPTINKTAPHPIELCHEVSCVTSMCRESGVSTEITVKPSRPICPP